MKYYLLASVLLFLFPSANATTYYSTNNSAVNLVTSWHTARNGTGSIPSNFSNTDIFIIQTGQTVTTLGNWNISGTNAKIIIEANATFTANDKVVVDKFEVDAGATFVHNDNSNTFPGDVERTLAVTSTVKITDWNGSAKLPSPTTWGNLTIDLDGYDNNINQAGALTDIAGNFTIMETGQEFRLATAQDYTLTIGGNLIIQDGTLECSSSNSVASQTIIIGGSYIQSGGTFIRSNNKLDPIEIQFDGAASAFTKTGGTLDATYMNWKVNASKKVILNNDLLVALSRSLTVNGTLDCEDGKVTGTGSFVLSATGKITTSNSLGLSGCLTLTGGTTLTTGGSYEFDSPTTTPFPASLASVSATNLVIGANITFNKNVTITGTMTLTSGKATIPAGNTVTISSGNAVAGSGFSSSKHIVTQVNTSTGAMGYLRIQNFTGTRILPVGTGTYYLPTTLIATGSNDFSVCVYNGITANGLPNGVALTAAQKKRGVDAAWIVNRNGGTSGVSLQLSWPDALEGSSFSAAADNELGIAHYGTYWETAFGTGSQSSNTVMRTGIVSFSPFTPYISTITLPLTFGGIKATQVSSGVRVDWYTLTETDVDHFEVERSTDGNNYKSIGRVAAAGHSASRKDYTLNDPISTDGIFFYRIRTVDGDGRVHVSPMVRINVTQQSAAGLLLYPNPVTDKKFAVEAGFLVAGTYKLYVFDQSGTPVFQQSFDHSGGTFTKFIDLPSTMKLGVYNVSITGNQDTHLTKSFVVK